MIGRGRRVAASGHPARGFQPTTATAARTSSYLAIVIPNGVRDDLR